MSNSSFNIKSLLPLAVGGFGIGLTEFVIMGILPSVAHSLGVSIDRAGHFIAAYALGVVVGAPLLTGLGRKLPSRRILLLLMGWFTVFNTLSAFSGSYGWMLLFRFLSGLPHGAFFGIGAVIASKLARPGREAQAIAIMFAGLTIANVLGVPAGAYIGNTLHWSMSFLMVGLVGIATLLSIYRWLPEVSARETSGDTTAPKGIRNGQLWALIILTAVGTGGFFAWYSYIAPLLTDVAGHAADTVSLAMVLAGLGMVVGNFAGAKMVQWFRPVPAVVIGMTGMSLMLILNALTASDPVWVLVMSFVIGMVTFMLAAPIQMAILDSARGSEMLASAMNQSAFNMANASGAYLAGIPIAFGYGVIYAGLVGAVLAGMGAMIALGIILARRKAGRRQQRRNVALSEECL